MFIYVATNTLNGKQYVGQTRRSPVARWRSHIAEARRKPSCPYIHHAIVKYGSDVFVLDCVGLAGCTQSELDFAERWFIDELRTMVPNGYNVEPGGLGGLHSEETKRRIGLAHTGMKRSEQVKINMSTWQKGKCHRSPESIRMSALAITGRRHSPESIEKMRKKALAYLAVNPRPRGYSRGPMSEEQKARISVAKKGKPQSETQKQKTSTAMRVRWQDSSYREKVLTARGISRKVEVGG